MDDLTVIAGIQAYPRLGDRIYSAPTQFISMVPQLMDGPMLGSDQVLLEKGAIDAADQHPLRIKPEKLFGRHCAILGATGGGKSWTTARIVEECAKHEAKLILLDATGEYKDFTGEHIKHYHLGEPVEKANGSVGVSVPSTSFEESDFVAQFEPAGRVQGPKLRAAMKSLRLAKLRPGLASDGYIKKIGQLKEPIENSRKRSTDSSPVRQPVPIVRYRSLSATNRGRMRMARTAEPTQFDQMGWKRRW